MAGHGDLVVGFGTNRSECGWAVTANLVGYERKRRDGTWETTFVGRHGRVQQLIVAESREEGERLRDYLNAAPHVEAADIVRRRGVSADAVEVIGMLLDFAWAQNGSAPELDLGVLIWRLASSPEAAVNEWRELVRTAQTAQSNGGTQPYTPFDHAHFPFSAIIFDLDQTLVDSASLRSPEARRLWARGQEPGSVIPFASPNGIEPHQLPDRFREVGIPVGIATRSPHTYAARVLQEFAIPFDALHAGLSKIEAIQACAQELQVLPQEVVVVGDDESDVQAAAILGAVSIGAAWAGRTFPLRMQPDISVNDPNLLIDHPDWWRLSYLAEQHDLERDPIPHGGSWISVSDVAYALGRYFRSRSLRHAEPLSQAILRGKDNLGPVPALGRAITLLASLVGQEVPVDLVTSVPPARSRIDRFEVYRAIAAESLGVESESALEELRSVGSMKSMTHQARGAANVGRWRARPFVAGRHILLLDDVITSGATLSACTKALRDAGAAEVTCVCFAATQD